MIDPVIAMNLSGIKGIGNKSMHAYILSAMMAIVIGHLYKNGSRSIKKTLSICVSFMAVVHSYTKLHKNYVSDKISIYFSSEDIKSVVTLFTPEIAVIEAHPLLSRASVDTASAHNSHVMSVELSKQVIAPGNPRKATRKIKLNHYHYHCEDNPFKGLTPQIVLTICGKKISSNIEVSFSNPKPAKSFLLDVKAKKYTRYTPIPDSNFIEKAMTMYMGKRLFLAILLDKYITQESSYTNAEKALYLLSKFSHLIHRSVLTSLRQKIRRSLCKDLQQSTCATEKVQLLLRYLDKTTCTQLPSLTLEKERYDSLKSDITALLKQRSSCYHLLHEILKQDDNLERFSMQNEEIIACYADNIPSKTSTLLRRAILSDKVLSLRLKAIHGYIDAHKIGSRTNFDHIILNSKLHEDSPENIYAHGALLELTNTDLADTSHNNYSIASIIEHAREKVSQKYCSKLLDGITGLIEKSYIRAEHLEIKIEKSRTRPCISEMESLSTSFNHTKYMQR